MTHVTHSRIDLQVPRHTGLHSELDGAGRGIEAQSGEPRVELRVVQAVGAENPDGESVVGRVCQAEAIQHEAIQSPEIARTV